MKYTKEEFEQKCREIEDLLLLAMAESPEIDPEKFYSMACFLENLVFFSPMLHDIIEEYKKQTLNTDPSEGRKSDEV